MAGINSQGIPKEIIAFSQWVNWRAEKKDNGKITKIPICSKTGRKASHSDEKTWSSYQDASNLHNKGKTSGIGFVFTKDDPLCGIDLDHCRDPETGKIEKWAKEIIKDFQSYTEISPSSTGVHIIVRGQLPEGGRKKENVEIYDRLHFFCITGQHLEGTPQDIRPAQNAINGLLSSHFKKEGEPQAKPPYSLPQVSESDAELIQKAIQSKNGHKFNLLYRGQWENAGYPSQSEADQAFSNLLAFWTGKDTARTDAIFRQSGLMRPKWDKRHYSDGRTYGQATVELAIASCDEVYKPQNGVIAKPHTGLNPSTDPPFDEAKKPVIPSLLPVPVDAFPDDIQTIINSLAKAHGTTFEVAVLAVLAVSGSLIGWSRQLIVKDGWYVHAALYAATEAETGEGKSPTTDFLLKPVEELERQEFLKHKAAMEEYEVKFREWQAEKKELRGKPPELPLRKRYKMGDCTIEAMADALDGNPKGLLWYREELNGLLLDLDKYTGKEGSTKTKLLEAYDLKPWQIDRVNKDRTAYIPKACLGLFGTIQPKILFQAFDDLDAASGFLPRFIIIHSAKTGPTLWSDAGMSDSMGKIWSRYVQALASYELADNEDAETVSLKSCLVKLSEDAKSEYIAWYDRIAIQPWNNVADGLFKAIVPKMQEQALRICLILHCLESIASDKKETLPVQGDTMRRALRLADWVWSHQKRMWSLLNTNTAEAPAPLEQRIAAAIIALETEIENSILLTKRITEKLNEGFEKKYHIKPESVGHACAKRLKLQRGPDKNNRGWIITPAIIGHLKSVYGLTAKITAITAETAENPYPQVNTAAGSYFATARTAQENTGSVFNCPTTARTLNPHQPREMGSMGSSGGYLPETSNNPNIANQLDFFDNPLGNPEWQESLNSLIETEALPEDDRDMEVFEV